MNRPVCLSNHSDPVTLVDGVRAASCRSCAGHWIPRHNDDAWLSQHGKTLPAIEPEPGTGKDLPAEPAAKPRFCPSCQKFLTKLPVGRGLPIHVDHCAGCGGFWLDLGEWDAPEASQLHDELHFIASPHWQRSVRHERARQLREQHFVKRFDAGFEWIRAVRKRIDEHPESKAIHTFLSSEDPLAVG